MNRRDIFFLSKAKTGEVRYPNMKDTGGTGLTTSRFSFKIPFQFNAGRYFVAA